MHSWIIVLTVACSALSATLGAENKGFRILDTIAANSRYTATLQRTDPSTAAHIDSVSENVLSLSSHHGVPLSQMYLDLLTTPHEEKDTSIPVKSIQQSNVNVVHTMNLKVGGKDYTVALDTGSADTWLAGSGFKCVNRRKQEIAIAKCKFGTLYVKSSTFALIEDRHLNTSYADGSFASGSMATETVTVGNITIKQQPMGIIDMAAWEGDGFSTGLMGLAYPSITNAYPGKGPGVNKKGTSIPYPPIFTNMYQQKLIAPIFSLTLNRPKEGPGALAFGGLPGPGFNHTGDFARVPLQYLSISPRQPSPKGEDGIKDYMFYVVAADGFTVDSQVATSAKTEVIVDTGSPLSYLPKEVAKAIHSKWSPPVTQDRLTKQYLFNCKSVTPPRIGVKFGNKVVYWAPEDLIVTASGGLCISGIQEALISKKGTSSPSVLGGSFLKNVVAVFDVGAGEIRFANRVR